MLSATAWAIPALAAYLAAGQSSRPAVAAPGQGDFVLIRGRVVEQEQKPPAKPVVIIVTPAGRYRVPDPSQTKTQPDGTFEVQVSRGPAWQLLDVMIQGAGFYRSKYGDRQLRREEAVAKPRTYQLEPLETLAPEQLAATMEELEEIAVRGGDSVAFQNEVAILCALHPVSFAANTALRARADQLTVALGGAPIPTTSIEGVTSLPTSSRNIYAYLSTMPGVARIGESPVQSVTEPSLLSTRSVSDLSSASLETAAALTVARTTGAGTNRFAGFVSGQFGNDRMKANNHVAATLGRATPPFELSTVAASLGGPVLRNQVFFYAAYEGERLADTNVTFLNLPPQTPGDAATAEGIARLDSKAADWQRDENADLGRLRVDVNLDSQTRVTVPLSVNRYAGDNALGTGSQRSVENTGGVQTDTGRAGARLSHVFSPNVVNEAEFQYVTTRDSTRPNTTSPEVFVFEQGSQVLTFGQNDIGARDAESTLLLFSNAVTWLKGRHNAKGGLTVSVDRSRRNSPDLFAGVYTFASIASFTRGRPSGEQEQYQQNFRGSASEGAVTRPDFVEYSGYIQDSWRVNNRIIIESGVRYELTTVPRDRLRNPDAQLLTSGVDTSRVPRDRNNVAPRMSLIWANTDATITARASTGWYYGRFPSDMLSAAERYDGLHVLPVTFSGSQVPTYPASFASIDTPATSATLRATQGVSGPGIMYFAEGFQLPRTIRTGGGVEWAAFSNVSVGLNYEFADGRHLPRSRDRNFGALTSRRFTLAGTGTTVDTPFLSPDGPFVAFGRVVAFESTADLQSHRITADVTRRYTNHVFVRGSYTFSRVMDTVPDGTATVLGRAADDAKYTANPQDPSIDRAPANGVQDHRLVVSATFDTKAVAQSSSTLTRWLVSDWTVGALLTAQSGVRFSGRVGTADINGDGNLKNDFAPGTSRNQFRLPGSAILDLQVNRQISIGPRMKLTVGLSAFNLTNDAVVTSVDQNYFKADLAQQLLTRNENFGRRLRTISERSARFTARLQF